MRPLPESPVMVGQTSPDSSTSQLTRPLLVRVMLAVFAFALSLGLVGVALANVVSTDQQDNFNEARAAKAATSSSSCEPSWHVVSSPNPDSVGPNYLYSVDALTENDAWAAGSYSVNSQPRSMMQHWDGTDWKVSPSSVVSEALTGDVAIISANDVWAIGYQWHNGPDSTFTMHWNGTQWSEVSSPNPCDNNTLKSVSGTSANDVWAVGYSTGCSGQSVRTMILHWDGVQWLQASSPNPSPNDDRLWDVEAISANDAWAVGFQGDIPNIQTLTLHWDGISWNTIPSPNVSSSQHLWSVSSSSGNDVWAIGDYYNPPTIGLLIMHWDGVAWSIVPPPSYLPGNYNHFMLSVKALSAEDAFIVGYYINNSPDVKPGHTLTLHWNGEEWTYIPSPDRGIRINELKGVAATSSNDYWAVGYTWNDNGTPFLTLIEHYSPDPGCTPEPTVTGTPPTSTPRPTRTSTVTATATRTRTSTSTSVTPSPPTSTALTSTPISTPMATASTTPTACTTNFTDVPERSTFYGYVRCMSCRGIISGYGDGTFRLNNDVTRGQLTKIVSNSAGFEEDSGPQLFEDVASDSTFYDWINRLANRGYIGGYPCGGPGEPCGSGNLPYFRPNANATRGQISKIVSNTVGYADIPAAQTFEDVPATNTFYLWIERLASRGIMGGYPCGGVNEPCGPESRPYFCWGNNATRGQTAKIVANTFFPDCQTLKRP